MSQFIIQLDRNRLEQDLLGVKSKLIQQARNVKLNQDPNRVYKYRESERIWQDFRKRRKAEDWVRAYYDLHLYLRIVLESRLHIDNSRDGYFQEQAAIALQRLKRVEAEMNICLRGIRYQMMLAQQKQAILAREKEREMEIAREKAALKKQEEAEEEMRLQKLSEEMAAQEKEKQLEKTEEFEDEEQHEEEEEEEEKDIIRAEKTETPILDKLEEEDEDKDNDEIEDDEEDQAVRQKKSENESSTGLSTPLVNVKTSLETPGLTQTEIAPVDIDTEVKQELKTLKTLESTLTHETPASATHSQGQILDSTRMLGTQVSEKSIKPLSFRVQQIAGDGNCAFRAIAQGFHNGKLDTQTENRDALGLRKLVTKKLVEMRNQEMTGTGLTVEQVILMDDDPTYSTFPEYIHGMSTTKFAGATEFWILSQVLKRPISVYKDENGEYKEMVTYGNGNGEAIRMLWRKGGGGRDANHYDLILPK